MATAQACPECGAAVAADAPLGVCPACVLKVMMAGAAATQEYTPTPGGGPDSGAPEAGALGALFPQLEIHELIGRGGMGAVYKARQAKLDRRVALKVIRPESAGEPGFAERFAREARAMARLAHPNIVTIYDFGEAGGLCYIVMEHVDGTDLRRDLAGGPVEPGWALDYALQIGRALHYAHGQGVIHRDIKPENVLIDPEGRVKIADFGLAKLLQAEGGSAPLTQTRHVVGTLRYMAPEQLERPQGVDHRADVYSLGVLLYEMLTGELPLGRFALPSERVEVDPALDAIVAKALEHDPDRRYPSVAALMDELWPFADAHYEMGEALPWTASRTPAAVPAVAAPPASPAPQEGLENEDEEENAFEWVASRARSLVFGLFGVILMLYVLSFPVMWAWVLLKEVIGQVLGQFHEAAGDAAGPPQTALSVRSVAATVIVSAFLGFGLFRLARRRRPAAGGATAPPVPRPSALALQGMADEDARVLGNAFNVLLVLTVAFFVSLGFLVHAVLVLQGWQVPAATTVVLGLATFGSALFVANLWGRISGAAALGGDPAEDQARPEPSAPWPPELEATRRRIRGPALGLIVVGLVHGVIGLGLFGVSVAYMALSQVPQYWYEQLLGIAYGVLALLVGAMMMAAGFRALDLRSRRLALVSCLAGMVLISPVSLVAFPMGIWGLAVLTAPEVVDAFRARRAASRRRPQASVPAVDSALAGGPSPPDRLK
jgi:tRNA A-37 threonylcarbamoyl transferase component Bud32